MTKIVLFGAGVNMTPFGDSGLQYIKGYENVKLA
jgi:hypothetical protein